jgi:uncharacterized membrane protein
MADKEKDENKKEGADKPIHREIESNIGKIVEIENAQKLQMSTGEKVSEAIARFCGSMTFVYVHIIWFGAWIFINSGLKNMQFDPFPYTFLTLVVSLEAIFLSTFILISQNHETKLTERRNHLDLQVNMLAEQENTKMLQLIQRMADKMGVKYHDPHMAALIEEMEPAELLEQIVVATADDQDKAQADLEIAKDKTNEQEEK